MPHRLRLTLYFASTCRAAATRPSRTSSSPPFWATFAAGPIGFTERRNPAAPRIAQRKATIDKFEVWFKAPDGNVVSISRSTKTWRLVVPIEKVDDSRKYLYFEGDCKPL